MQLSSPSARGARLARARSRDSGPPAHGRAERCVPACSGVMCSGFTWRTSGTRLRLELQDRRAASRIGQGIRVERGVSALVGPAHDIRRLPVSPCGSARGAGRGRSGLGLPHRDQAAARRGGRRALGAAAGRRRPRAGSPPPRRSSAWPLRLSRCCGPSAPSSRSSSGVVEGRHQVPRERLFLAVAVRVRAAAMFLAVGALASQLAATRRQASATPPPSSA